MRRMARALRVLLLGLVATMAPAPLVAAVDG